MIDPPLFGMHGAGAVAACRVVGVWVTHLVCLGFVGVMCLVCLGFGELVQAPLHMGPRSIYK